jgi:ATP-binding protein involved in chromosome partitioning
VRQPTQQTEIEDDKKTAATLARIKNRLLVFSGKGGVGKTTVAANLAVLLSQRGMRVGLLDVDIHGPNLAKMLGAEGKKMATVRTDRIIPVTVAGNVKLVSMSFLLASPDLAVIWRGPLKMHAIRQFLGDVEWGSLDWLIVDSPPGTGDEPLSVAQLIPQALAVIVTTPQEVSLLDSRKAVFFAKKLKMELLGIIENMSGFVCPHCGKKIDLFKQGGGERAAKEVGVPFLGRIPINPHIVESGDDGTPFVLSHQESKASRALTQIAEKILKGRSK